MMPMCMQGILTGLAGASQLATGTQSAFLKCSRGPAPARAASRVRARLQPQALLIQRLFPFTDNSSTASKRRAQTPSPKSRTPNAEKYR